MRLSELLDRKVVTESGEQLGRVHDVRGELAGGRFRITGLSTGNLGILERYGVGTRGSGGPGTSQGPRPSRHCLGAGDPCGFDHRRPRRAGERRLICVVCASNGQGMSACERRPEGAGCERSGRRGARAWAACARQGAGCRRTLGSRSLGRAGLGRAHPRLRVGQQQRAARECGPHRPHPRADGDPSADRGDRCRRGLRAGPGARWCRCARAARLGPPHRGIALRVVGSARRAGSPDGVVRAATTARAALDVVRLPRVAPAALRQAVGDCKLSR